MKLKINLKLFSLLCLPLGLLAGGFGLWCLRAVVDMQGGMFLNTQMMMFGFLGVLELMRWILEHFVFFIFLLFGILCTWNGAAMLSNSILGLLVTAIHKEKAFRFLEYVNYLWYVLLLTGVILTAVCYFHGEIWKQILKSILLFWFGGVFLNSIPMLFINFAKEERKNL
ncbi:MAG: hypothetical protein IJ642_05195 [Oscillospiraceae bacterium]|nr:hypothetical protein [Oscillospiraceae bacterium]